MKKGDLVKVVDKMQIYSTFDMWMDEKAPEYKKLWEFDFGSCNDVKNGEIGIYLKKAKHLCYNETVCLIAIHDHVVMIRDAGIREV